MVLFKNHSQHLLLCSWFSLKLLLLIAFNRSLEKCCNGKFISCYCHDTFKYQTKFKLLWWSKRSEHLYHQLFQLCIKYSNMNLTTQQKVASVWNFLWKGKFCVFPRRVLLIVKYVLIKVKTRRKNNETLIEKVKKYARIPSGAFFSTSSVSYFYFEKKKTWVFFVRCEIRRKLFLRRTNIKWETNGFWGLR